MRRMSVVLSALVCLSLSVTVQAQTKKPVKQPRMSLDAYVKRVGTYLPAAGGQVESLTVVVKGQPISRQLTKTVEFKTYGDSAVVFCAREVTYLNAMGYRAWISYQEKGRGDLCFYRFRFGKQVSGQVVVNGLGRTDRLKITLKAKRSLTRPQAKRR